MDHSMYQAQIKALAPHFRCIAYDHRGHGRSEVTQSGYEIDNLTADAAALIEELDGAPCHFVGMSTGGFIGLRLGIRHPELLRSLTLIDTSADAETPDQVRQYDMLATIVRYFGWRLVLGKALSILFSPGFINDPQRQDEVKRWKQVIIGHNRKGVSAFARGIFHRDSVAEQLDQIHTPTVVIGGGEDVATPPELMKRIVAGIPGTTLHLIPNAGHSSVVEKPEAVTAVMLDFYTQIGAIPKD
ncbi:MAG: alpha/beta fold hydrolase [Aquificales bacterium]|nr:alpha/beta fold hydrolase [Aquificales bacterium]